MSTCQNLSFAERLTSLIVGGTSLAAFLRSPDKSRKWPMAAFGGLFLARGVAAYCPLKRAATGAACAVSGDTASEATAGDRAATKRSGSPEESWTERKDLVQEASEESFPASDAPSFNPGAIH